MRSGIPTTTLLGVGVAVLDIDAALAEVRRLLDGPDPALLAYANAHALNVAVRNEEFLRVLREADLVLNDGSGLALAARLRGLTFPANLNGTDFTPKVLLTAADCGASVFLLGGRPGVAQDAADRLSEAIPGLKVAGCADGYYAPEHLAGLLATIRQSKAKLLLVGMGNPQQELWLAEHLADTGACLGMAVGAFLDFAANRVPRAPLWMRSAGIEWVYRLAREPRRLFGRYVAGNPLFLQRVVREQLTELVRPRESGE
ncbi:MAG TPA: WecB/TagA/CpsF family glycosyltransferase [Pseudonocardiaceae bacterium]|jgi:exopolysaccharide biosynthesis WecB/TagA/CpsF family protein|nr:WecB/TagA/CpsF family glycosyltransferase [Pseudonocardiaceae bacterium]